MDKCPFRGNYKILFLRYLKTITARSSKLGQLIEEMMRLPGENLKKNQSLPFANLNIENLISQILLQLAALNKLEKLIEDNE